MSSVHRLGCLIGASCCLLWACDVDQDLEIGADTSGSASDIAAEPDAVGSPDTVGTPDAVGTPDVPSQGAKLDLLLVIDHSTSMCDEQVQLAGAVDAFFGTLQAAQVADVRVAVTTMDMQCDPDEPGVTAARGVFNQHAFVGKYPPACYVNRAVECTADADCDAALGGTGKWFCDGTHLTVCLVNPNGSVNSRCVYRCEADADCAAFATSSSYTCQTPPGLSGCSPTPPTSDCPEDLPPYLEASDLALVRCSASVGVNQLGCFDYEQGLQAAWSALDPSPDNPNAVQASAFLRDDAWLGIIFVSDEDDCSVPPESSQPIGEDYYDTCALLLEDTDHGGPLVPVNTFVNRYRSLKADPAKVLVAAVVGDSLAEDPATKTQQRNDYVASKTDDRTCFHESYICSYERTGQADWGARYHALVEAFGAHGWLANICSPSGIPAAMDEIAAGFAATIAGDDAR